MTYTFDNTVEEIVEYFNEAATQKYSEYLVKEDIKRILKCFYDDMSSQIYDQIADELETELNDRM